MFVAIALVVLPLLFLVWLEVDRYLAKKHAHH